MIVHVITGLGDGGAEGVLYRLCKHDRGARHVVISLLGDGGRFAEPLRQLGVPVHNLGMQRGRAGPLAIARLAWLLRQYRPAVVQTWLYHADLLGGTVARLLGVPHVSWGIRHGRPNSDQTKRSTAAIARLCARLSRMVPHAIISCSETAKDFHVAAGYDAAKFMVIPNGYESRDLSPDENLRQDFRSELGVPDEMPLFGTVARFHPAKDHATLLRALGRVAAAGHRFHVALVGTGMTADNAQLNALASELDIADRIHFLGRRDDIAAVMNGLDLHISSSATEGFPNAVAEAMFCGTPCVVTDVGDSALIAGQMGWAAEPSNSVALADAIQLALGALTDREAWSKRQHAARRHVVERFDIDGMVAAYHKSWGGRRLTRSVVAQRGTW